MKKGNPTMKLKQILLITGAYLLTTSLLSAPFTDNGDGTVKDNATGLVWQKCTFGKTYANGICSGTASSLNWNSAITSCNGLSLAGKTWRLPNRNELLSIVDYTRTDVAIDISVFDYSDDYYWSSSTLVYSTGYAWLINFRTGVIVNGNNISRIYGDCCYNYTKSSVLYSRCVAGP